MTGYIDTSNRSAWEYHRSVSHRFMSLCDLLKEIGVKGFNYNRFFSNGSYLLLVSNKNIADYFFPNVSDQGDFYTSQVESTGTMTKNLLMAGDISQFDEKKDPIIRRQYEEDYWNVFNSYEILEDNSFEGFGFSLGRDFSDPAKFFLEKAPLLEEFKKHFKEAGQDLIRCEDKRRLAVFNQQFSLNKEPIEAKLSLEDKQFLERIADQKNSTKLPKNGLSFSKREMECLIHLSELYSSKEIGRAMNLSSRTVEGYLQTVKHKVGCSTKTDLLRHLRNYGIL